MTSEIYEDEKMTSLERDLSSREAFRKLLPLLKEHKKKLLICLFLLSGATILSLYWPILMKRAMDVNIKNSDLKGLILTVGLIGVIQAVTLILLYLQRVKLEIIGQDVMLKLKKKLFDHILESNISFFDKNPIGRLMARIESDTESLRMMFTNTVIMLMGDLILIIGIFFVMLYYSWKLTLILTAFFPIFVVLIIIFEKTTSPRFLAVRKRMAEVTATMTEYLHGMSIIQIFHRGEYVKNRMSAVNELKFRAESRAELIVVAFFNSIHFLEYAMIAMVLFFGVKWMRSGELTVGTFSMFIVLIWRSFEPIYTASGQLSHIQKAIAGGKRIFALLSSDNRLPDPVHPVEWNGLKEGIRFEKVWFSYTGDDDYVLKDADFEVPVGSQVALAGVTGGGKSTIISLLLRLYDPQKGKITVDGIDIRDITKEDLRKRFSLVLQDIFLFPGDVAFNIALDSGNGSEEKIIAAAKTVDADRFISRLPDGYKTEVSEKGANFSRGERQLLSFARALVNDPDLLILDEATSSVDPDTERTIQQSMKKLMEGRTSLIIAHRLSTILEADQILVIRRGEIIERGTHTELILKNGYYSRLFHLQFKNGVMANVG
jgi:ATP-binding cassette subfamily B protein